MKGDYGSFGDVGSVNLAESSPTLVNSYTGAPATHGTYATPIFTPPPNAVLVGKAATQDASYGFTSASIYDSTGLTWTAVIDDTASYCGTIISWARVGASPVAMTVSFNQGNISGAGWGWCLEVWQAGMIATAATDVRVSGTATTSFTTHANGSVVTALDGDWNDINGASRAYEPATSETDYYYASGKVTIYCFYNTEANTGTYTIGVTSPGGQKATILALEIQPVSVPSTLVGDTDTGSAADAGQPPPATPAAADVSISFDGGENIGQTGPYPTSDAGSATDAELFHQSSSDASSLTADAGVVQPYVPVYIYSSDASRKPALTTPSDNDHGIFTDGKP